MKDRDLLIKVCNQRNEIRVIISPLISPCENLWRVHPDPHALRVYRGHNAFPTQKKLLIVLSLSISSLCLPIFRCFLPFLLALICSWYDLSIGKAFIYKVEGVWNHSPQSLSLIDRKNFPIIHHKFGGSFHSPLR